MLALLPALALSAGLDADGDGVPAADSEGAVGLVPVAPRGDAGQGAVTAMVEGQAGALVRQDPDGNATTLVGEAVLARAQLGARFLPWLSATASMPFRLAASSDVDSGGPSLGDLQATGWLGDRIAFGLGATLPSGSTARYTGAGRVVPHARLAGSWDADVGPGSIELMGAGWAAVEGQPSPVDAVGGVEIGAAARVGGSVGRGSAGLSFRSRAPLDPEIVSRRGVPLEAALDAGIRATDRLRASVVISQGLVRGVGAPQLRAGAGVSWLFGPKLPAEVVPVVVDTARTITIVDPDGRAVAGAKVILDGGEPFVASAEGRVTLPETAGTVRARGLEETLLPAVGTDVVMGWATVPLDVQLTTVDGSDAPFDVTLTGPTPITFADPGDYRAELLPGTWSLELRAPGYGTQSRTIEVPPRSVEPIDLEVVLLPKAGDAALDLELTDPQGRGVSGAELRVDGVSIGTAARGTVGIEGLAAEEVSVEVSRKSFRVQETLVDLTGGAGQADVELYYAPGTVRVTAMGPAGPISDGLLLVDGPRALPPIPLGDGGESLIELGTGSWLLALSSPAHGLQERELDIDADSPVPVDAAFVLLGAGAVEEGPASLWVDVRDLDGQPIVGASIRLDGRDVGTTATGGSLRLEGLPEGPVTILASGPGFLPVERLATLTDGLEVVTLPVAWNPGTIQVSARDPEGPVDALVAFAGPDTYPGGPLGPPGRRTFLDVPTGDWEVMASHVSGMEVAWATSRPDAGRRTQVDFRLGDLTGDGQLSLTTKAPDGKPVDGAELWFQGRPLVTTAGGGVRVAGLPVGPVDLEIRHPHHETVQRTLDVSADGTELDVELPWIPGLIDLVVDSTEPLDGALAYASGDHPVDPRPVVKAGEPVRMALGPGTWDLLVTATNGIAQTQLELPEAATAPPQVRLRFGRAPGPLVHVVDHRANPIPGIPLRLDGVSVAVTDASGTAVIPVDEPPEGQPVGTIRPVHPGFAPVEAVTLTYQGEHWFELEALPRPVEVQAYHENRPVTVVVSANGPARVAKLDVVGSGTLQLPPGTWEIVVDPGEELAAARKEVVVPLAGSPPTVRFDLKPAQVRATAGSLQLIDVKFEIGEDVAGDAYADVLEEVAASIGADSTIRRVEVQGHTDPTGDSAFNYDLSTRRAASIVARLVELGVPPELLEARGYGPSRPIAPNDTPEGRALNRRVDFQIMVP